MVRDNTNRNPIKTEYRKGETEKTRKRIKKFDMIEALI